MTKVKYFGITALISYIILYCLPFPFDLVIYSVQIVSKYLAKWTDYLFFETTSIFAEEVSLLYESVWQKVTPWFAKHLLNYDSEITNFSNGSGDTLYDYTNIIVKLFFSILLGIILFFRKVDFGKINKMFFFITTYLRYYVGYMLFSYGMVKILPSQFPYPFLGRLMQPYGESSPMGLLWTFMGYSQGYNMFSGTIEVLSGFFLLFRRTKTFGAILSIAVFSMIFVINLCYDVPVKLFSGHLLIFSMLIIYNDIIKIGLFFFKNKSIQLKKVPFAFEDFKRKNLFIKVRFTIVLLILFLTISQAIDSYYQYGNGRKKDPFQGIYNIDYKIINNDTVLLKYKDTVHWKQIIISISNSARIRLLNDSIVGYDYKLDTIKRTIELIERNNTLNRQIYHYTFSKDLLFLKGVKGADSIKMKFDRYDESNFLLNRRGFHWINEFPYNK